MGARKIIITCEHAGNYVPKDFNLLFLGHEEVLNTHLGWDPGALIVAKNVAKSIGAPLFYHKMSRLLVEVNRSIGHEKLFSEFTIKLDKLVQQALIDKYYYPYRHEVENRITNLIAEESPVLHISVHTFTPELNGVKRSVDLGILFDDKREEEVLFANEWTDKLYQSLSKEVILHNCPYHGADDGFTTYLRTKFSDHQYLGIELEVNQKYVETGELKRISKAVSESLF